MAHQKFRWSKVYESSEEELIDVLQSRNLRAQRVTAEESNARLHQVTEHAYTLWCAEGSLILRQGPATISLQPGDAVQVEADIPYDLQAGIAGYVCFITDSRQ